MNKLFPPELRTAAVVRRWSIVRVHNRDNIAEDHSGATVFLARNDWQLNRAKQDHPQLRFLQTREQAPLTQASA